MQACSLFRVACRSTPGGDEADGQGQLIEYRIVADGFLPRMVRNIVGALDRDRTGRPAADLDRRTSRTARPALGSGHGPAARVDALAGRIRK